MPDSRLLPTLTTIDVVGTDIVFRTFYVAPEVLNPVSVLVDSAGDLIVDNTASPLTLFSLTNGDLLVSGSNEDKYSINSNGDLIFTL